MAQQAFHHRPSSEFDPARNPEVENGNSGAAAEIDFSESLQHVITLTAGCTLTFVDPVGPWRCHLRLVQDGTGSRTVTWPSNVLWPGGSAPTLTAAASSTDVVTLHYDPNNDKYYGVASLNFS